MNILIVETIFYKSQLNNYLYLAKELARQNINIYFLAGNSTIKNFFLKNNWNKVFNIEEFIDPIKGDFDEILGLCKISEKKYQTTFSNPVYEISSIREVYLPELAYLQAKENGFKNCKKVIEYLEAINKIFQQNKFGFILQLQGAEILRRCTSIIARKYKIPEYFIGFTPIKNHVSIYQNEFAIWENIKIKELNADEETEILNFIKDFKTNKTTHIHKKLNIFNFWVDRLKGYKGSFYTDEYNNIIYRLSLFFKKKSFAFLGKLIAPFIYSKFNKEENYFFYPMHYPAESQVTIRSNKLTDQFFVIKLISKSLPQGITLYVKEHPNIIGTQSLKGLIDIKKLSNVKLIPPDIHPHEVIKNSKGVVTINSTAGLEGLIYEKPVVILGKVFYRGYGATYDVKELNELPFKIKEALNSPFPKKIAQELLYAIIKASYPGGWDRTENLEKLINSLEKKVLVSDFAL